MKKTVFVLALALVIGLTFYAIEGAAHRPGMMGPGYGMGPGMMGPGYGPQYGPQYGPPYQQSLEEKDAREVLRRRKRGLSS